MKEIIEAIKKCKTFAIVGHVNPDEDCIGSCDALRMALVAIGKKEQQDCDLLFIVDCGSLSRIDGVEMLEKAKKTILLDHHLQNDIKADYKIVNENYASTTAIVYELLVECKFEITSEIATALYIGLATDTGCFLYGDNLQHAHAVAAELLKFGVDYRSINYDKFRKYTIRQKALIQYCLKKMKYYLKNQICILKIPYKIKLTDADKNVIMKYIHELEGIKIGALIIEAQKKYFKASVRSVGDIDVSAVCRALGGGGHFNASGCASNGKYSTFLKRLLAECKKALE